MQEEKSPKEMTDEEAQELWDKAWADYLKAVKEQGLEERRAPPGFWNQECDY